MKQKDGDFIMPGLFTVILLSVAPAAAPVDFPHGICRPKYRPKARGEHCPAKLCYLRQHLTPGIIFCGGY